MRQFTKTKCVFLKQKRNVIKILKPYKKASVSRCLFIFHTFNSNLTFSSPASSCSVRSILFS